MYHISYIIKYHHIPSYIIKYHHIPSYIIIYHHISSYITIYHHISSYIIIYHQSSYIIYHHIPSYIIHHHISTRLYISWFLLPTFPDLGIPRVRPQGPAGHAAVVATVGGTRDGRHLNGPFVIGGLEVKSRKSAGTSVEHWGLTMGNPWKIGV